MTNPNCCNQQCSQGRDCPNNPAKVAPFKPHHSDVGNAWFDELEPLSRADVFGFIAIAIGTLLITASAIGYFYQAIWG